VHAIIFLAAMFFVPLDDRPVTRQLPEMLGQIAGVRIIEPPRKLLGRYLTPGKPDAIISWLNNASQENLMASFVISSDMLAYGGLVASRIPSTSYNTAQTRLREFTQLRHAHPGASIDAFGTIMRLAPTGVPAIGDAASFFAAFPVWQYLQEYANLHDPPFPAEAARADELRTLIGKPTLDGYIEARTRNYGIDLDLVRQTASGTLNALVLGQDDAGVIGLHVKEVQALEKASGPDVSIEPGADELGMVLVARELARRICWVPRVAVRYYGTGLQDLREFTSIPETIDHLITISGAIHDDEHPDITLYVRLPQNSGSSDDRLVTAMQDDETHNSSIALADLTFLQATYDAQAAFARRILQDGVASKLDGYAAWNTNANTVGTVLAETIAANAGRRSGTYNALAHREFTFIRLLDDYAFHDEVRPQLNAALDAQGITDHTYLLPAIARRSEEQNNFLLAQQAPTILAELYPGLHIAAMRTTLPWNRTFETEIEVGLAPNLPRGGVPNVAGEEK